MVALATLGTGQQTPLRTQTKASTDHTHVLEENTSLVTSFDKRRTFIPLVFHQEVQFSMFKNSFNFSIIEGLRNGTKKIVPR